MIGYDVFPGLKRRCITFSFDEGYPNDEQLKSLLEKYGVKATFYKKGTEVLLERQAEGHYKQAMETCENFLNHMRFLREDSLLHIWGSSLELDSEEEWEKLESILQLISENRNIWYATNEEVFSYLEAQRALVISEDEKIFFNPSQVDVCIQRSGNESFCIPAGIKIDMRVCE